MVMIMDKLWERDLSADDAEKKKRRREGTQKERTQKRNR